MPFRGWLPLLAVLVSLIASSCYYEDVLDCPGDVDLSRPDGDETPDGDADTAADGDEDGDAIDGDEENASDGDEAEEESPDGDGELDGDDEIPAVDCHDLDEDGYYAGTDCEGVVDCDDDDKFKNPGMDDICNYKDDDCDGIFDEDAADCPPACRAKMDCNQLCQGTGGTGCWESCQNSDGNAACDACYDAIIACGYRNGCFPGNQWDDACMQRYCREETDGCLGAGKQDGVCGRDYLPCADACPDWDDYCPTECWYRASLECRTCMEDYNDCLNENDCILPSGDVDTTCFYTHCFTVYDPCITGFTEPECRDADDDGYGLYCPLGRDCDDGNPDVHPGAAEICNGRDDDCDGKIDDKQTGCAPPRRAWTYLAYMAGDNNLSDAALGELERYAAFGGTSDRVAAAVQIELSGSYSAYAGVLDPEVFERTWRLVVPADGVPDLESLFRNAASVGDLDISDAESLTRFLDWALAALPADRTALTIWDHGGGWTGALVDEGSGHFMSMPEMRRGLMDSPLVPDVLLFSACEMGMVEVLSEMSGQAGYVVASQEVAYSVRAENILALLHADPDITAEQLAIQATDIAANFGLENDLSHTWAAWNMAGADALVEAVAELGRRLTANIEALRPLLSSAMPEVQAMGIKSSRDLVDFIDELGVTDIAEVDEQLALVRSLALADDFLLNSRIYTSNDPDPWNPSLDDAHGLSVYLPDPVHTSDDDLADYGELAASLDPQGGWDEFIIAWLNGRELSRTVGNFRLDLSWTRESGDAAAVDLDLWVYEPRSGVFSPYVTDSTPFGTFSPDSLASGLAEEWYQADSEVGAGSYFVFVHYPDTGDEGVSVRATVAFTDSRFADNDQTYERHMSLERLCSLGEDLLNADVQAGRCSDFWLAGKLVRDNLQHTLLPGVYSDFGRELPDWRFIPMGRESLSVPESE